MWRRRPCENERPRRRRLGPREGRRSYRRWPRQLALDGEKRKQQRPIGPRGAKREATKHRLRLRHQRGNQTGKEPQETRPICTRNLRTNAKSGSEAKTGGEPKDPAGHRGAEAEVSARSAEAEAGTQKGKAGANLIRHERQNGSPPRNGETTDSEAGSRGRGREAEVGYGRRLIIGRKATEKGGAGGDGKKDI